MATKERPLAANAKRWLTSPAGTPMLRGRWQSPVTGLLALAVVGRLVLFANLSQAQLDLAVVAFIYAIVAIGIALLYAQGGLLSIVHGGLWGIAAYMAAILAMSHGWPMLPIMVVTAVSVAILAALLATLSTRVQGSYFVIILFAVAQIIQDLMTDWGTVTNGPEGIVVTAAPSIFGYQISGLTRWYYVTLVTLLVVVALAALVRRSRLGERMRAIRDNRDLSRSVGINVRATHMLAFAFSGALAAVAGVYWAYLEGYVDPSQYPPAISIEFILIILLGGAGYLLGPVVGAIVVVYLPTVLHLSPLLGQVVIGVIFIAVILLSPQGISGLADRSYRSVVARLARALRPKGDAT